MELADLLKTATLKELFMNTVWVTAYEVSLEYAGSEEGGRYIYWYHPAETIETNEQDAKQVEKKLEERHKPYLPGGSIYSVRGGHTIEIYSETTPQKSKTRTIPTYE
jgi:hypothetical protein